MVKSRVLDKLRSGGFVRTVGVSRMRDPWLAEVIGKLDFDLIWLDMEHRSFGNDIIDPIALACRAERSLGKAPLPTSTPTWSIPRPDMASASDGVDTS